MRGWSSARGRSNQRLTTFKRLGVPLVRFTLHWNEIALRRPVESDLAARPRLRLASSGPDSARPAPPRSDAGAHAGRHAGLGERRPPAELRPAAAAGLPRLRPRCRQALPCGSVLADLERAEQASLAQADPVGDLRPASAEPGYEGDPRRAAARPGRRRRHGASRRTGGVAPVAWVRGMAAAHAKLDAYAHHRTLVAGRDAVERRLQELPVDHDGDDPEARSSSSGAPSDRSRCG